MCESTSIEHRVLGIDECDRQFIQGGGNRHRATTAFPQDWKTGSKNDEVNEDEDTRARGSHHAGPRGEGLSSKWP